MNRDDMGRGNHGGRIGNRRGRGRLGHKSSLQSLVKMTTKIVGDSSRAIHL